MPSLTDELKADQSPRSKCRVCAWLIEQPEAAQAEWDAALADRAYTHTSVYRALLRRDVLLVKSTVENHRSNRHRQAG